MAEKETQPYHPEDKISAHFTWKEVYCRCGCIFPRKYAENAIKLAEVLEKVREALGDVPVIVNSWYRCPEHNRAVGGVPTSAHLTASAADIWSPRVPTPQLHETARALHKKRVIRGLGLYPDRIHVDIDGYRMWVYTVPDANSKG